MLTKTPPRRGWGMATKVTDTILPTTMIGSYPKPRWFEEYNVAGSDLLEWWKIEKHFQAYRDATAACIKDQEIAGLDIVTDGQMHFDQYGGGIGSFVWYWYERLGGFSKSKLPNPIARGIEASGEDLSQAAWMHDWGGTAVTAKVSRGIPGRLGEMYEIARGLTDKPLKVSVGAGPANLTFHVDLKYPGSHYSEQRKLAEDIVPIFNQDLKELVARGAEFIQIEDLGGWQLAWDPDSKWIIDVLNAWIDGVDAKIAWHSCLGAGYGNTFRAVEDALPRVLERWQGVKVQQFALDFALRNMVDVHALKELEPDREVQAGVIDIRSLYIETDDEIVRRIHKVLEHIAPERVYLTTDCGLKALPRFVAFEKLKALVRAANRVRAELPTPKVATVHGRREVLL
jgi:5-methyltetrahydropteroyltriglutamate--homocysteine methyltransferase